jgi:hypothetical protein
VFFFFLFRRWRIALPHAVIIRTGKIVMLIERIDVDIRHIVKAQHVPQPVERMSIILVHIVFHVLHPFLIIMLHELRRMVTG